MRSNNELFFSLYMFATKDVWLIFMNHAYVHSEFSQCIVSVFLYLFLLYDILHFDMVDYEDTCGTKEI